MAIDGKELKWSGHMRRDCTIDNVRVVARNASMIGHATYKVKAGTVFTYDENGTTRVARSLGRVSCHAENIRGHVLAMVLSDDATFTYIRWINPDDITRALELPPTNMAAFFFAPELPYDTATMIHLIEHGTMQDQFISQHAERVAMWKERNANAQGVDHA